MTPNGGCTATTKSGNPCQMAPQHGRIFCWIHDPEKADERARARRKGGFNRRRSKVAEVNPDGVSLREVDAVLDLLEVAVLDTLVLENSISRSRALAYLANQALKALEVSEIEHRLEALEARLTKLTR